MPSNMMENVYARARKNPKRIAFPEAEEEKILLACRDTLKEGFGTPVLVGDPDAIKAAAAQFGVSLDGMEIVSNVDESKVTEVVEKYLAKKDIFSEKALRRKAKDPLNFSMMLEDVGDVDCAFAGLTHTTGDVIMAASSIIGLAEGVETPSSIGIMDIPGYEGSEGNLLAFGDAAVCANPSSSDLASIAISACETVSGLLGWEPRCALLSYSTDGSAESEMIDRVREAVRIANERRGDLKIDGEFQLDSAILPAIAAKKVKRESAVAGKANIIIYPDINAGNIGVKLVQIFAHCDAYGPLLQGFAKPVSDCSRSAPVSELVGNIAMLVTRC